MAIDLKDKVVLVYDYGSWVETAIRLCRDYKEVLYFCPFEDNYIKNNPYIIGKGIEKVYPNFKRIENVDDWYDEVDLWVFTNCYPAAFQERLRNEGRLVYGSGKASELELYRSKLKDKQKEVGLPLNDYVEIMGITKLREYLKDKKNIWIKNDLFRDDNETWKFIDMDMSTEVLDRLEVDLGANKEFELFLAEQPVDKAVELAYDGFCIDGKYPRIAPVGLEVKNSSYVMKLIDYDNIPAPLKLVNDKLAPVFEDYGYKGSVGTEVRVTKDKVGILNDLTARQSQPPNAILVEIIENYGEVVWLIASGIVPELKYKYKYGCQLVIKSEWAHKYPQPIRFPEKYKDFIKIENLFITDGIYNKFLYKHIPRKGEESGELGLEQVGSIIGLGNSLQSAIDMVKEIAPTIEGYKLIINEDDLDTATEEIKKAEKFGIKFF